MADKEYDEMRLSGLLAFIHKIVMFVTLPFRKFWKTLIVIAAIVSVLIIIPLCYGVRFNNIWSWYKEKLPFTELISFKNNAVDKIKDKVNKAGEAVGIHSGERKEKKKYAVWNIKEFNQGKKDEAAKIPPQAGQLVVKEAHDIQKSEEENMGTKNKVVPEYHPYIEKAKKKQQITNNKPISDIKDLSSYYKVLNNQQLEYVSTPKAYDGTATVVGSNSLYVADMFVYLYGVYSDPQIHDLVKAQEYLVELTDNKDVKCYVVAYTVQTQTATALCFAGDVFLNKALVDKYLAGNIALK